MDATSPSTGTNGRLRHRLDAHLRAHHRQDRALPPPSGIPRPASPPRNRWVPSCNHTTMAIIYADTFKCMSCRQESPLGILYRCIVDKEPLILEEKNRDFPVAFDDIGCHFAEKMTLGKFGADARSQPLSVITEMSPDQLSSYTPEQLQTLLSQRQNVHTAIASERERLDHLTPISARQKYPDDKKPWVPDPSYECLHKVCHRCYRPGRDKSWVSLNSVMNGDILPSVATGFSFSFMGSRPIADASVVRNIGCRPVPLPPKHPAIASEQRIFSSITSNSNAATSTSPRKRVSQSPTEAKLEASADDVVATAQSTPFQGSEIYAADFIMEYRYSDYVLACCTPLPTADFDEERSLGGYGMAADNALGDESHVAPDPFDAEDGISLTEEAAESGTVDLASSASCLDAPLA